MFAASMNVSPMSRCVGEHCASRVTGIQSAAPLAWEADAVTTDLLERIIVDPAICFGKATIRGR